MKDFKEKVKYYINIHRELHGSTFKWEDVVSDFVREFPDVESMKVLYEIEKQEEDYRNNFKRYGIFLGRFMPFTDAHSAIVQEILRDGKIPIIILGGTNKVDDRHPLSYDDRVKLIKKVYPFDCKYIGLEDKNNWTEWYISLIDSITDLNIKLDQITLYYHDKAEDKSDFECLGKYYANENYTTIFRDNNINMKNVDSIKCNLGNVIHATDVRKDENIAKRNLDARIYRALKDKFNWWK